MNRFVEEFLQKKVIVVCRGIDKEEIVNVAKALNAGGICFMEIPFDQKNPQTFALTAEKIKLVKNELGEKMHVGAGTVLTMEQFELTKNAGAEIIVSPTLEEDIILATKKAGLVSMPGCATPSEITRAYKLGGDLIKLFPASVLTLKAIKEISIPLNHIPLVCFGGVNAENIKEVLSSGVVGVGMAGAILNKQALQEKNYSKITEIAKTITAQI